MVVLTIDVPDDIYLGNLIVSKLFGLTMNDMIVEMMKINMKATQTAIDEKAGEIHGKRND